MEIHARNVEEAWALFCVHMMDERWKAEHTQTVAPRGRETIEITEPVLTTYTNPEECVLTEPNRDAHPFFHLYEALYLLAGKNEVSRLTYYLPRFAEFTDDGLTFFGAYGYRLCFQINGLVDLLIHDPDSRRGVLHIGYPTDGNRAVMTKDLPCNQTVFVKIRNGVLNMTVCNRSNDACWGAYGTNAVQFSFLLQYLAARLNVRVGTYCQFSDSLHVYTTGAPGAAWQRAQQGRASTLWPAYDYAKRMLYAKSLVENAKRFDEELQILMAPMDGTVMKGYPYKEPFLLKVAAPMLHAFELYKNKEPYPDIYKILLEEEAPYEAWKMAGTEWLRRREQREHK
jgi:thymidylate synthase